MANQELMGLGGVRLHAWRNPDSAHPIVLDLTNGHGGALNGIVRRHDVWLWRSHLLRHSCFMAQTGIAGLPTVIRPGRLAADLRGLPLLLGMPLSGAEVWPMPGMEARKRAAARLLMDNWPLNTVLGRRWILLWYQ